MSVPRWEALNVYAVCPDCGGDLDGGVEADRVSMTCSRGAAISRSVTEEGNR